MWFSAKFETRQWYGRTNIFCQCENLEASPKHFWMEQRLQCALCFGIDVFPQGIAAQFGKYSSDEVMLIGETFSL